MSRRAAGLPPPAGAGPGVGRLRGWLISRPVGWVCQAPPRAAPQRAGRFRGVWGPTMTGGRPSGPRRWVTVLPAVLLVVAGAAIALRVSVWRLEIKPTDTREVAQLTGPGSINDTDARWDVHGADLGHTFWHGDRLAMVFGDVFGGPKSAGWRSNALAWIDDPEPEDGLTFSSMVTDANDRAAEILSSQKVNGREKTVLSIGGVSVDGRMFLHYTSIRRWRHPGETDVNHSGIASSDDDGQTWTKHPTVRWEGDTNFAQAAMMRHKGFVYLFGIPGGRQGDVALARVPTGDVLDADAYRYWDGSDWAASPTAAVPVAAGPAGELSVRWSSYHRRWLMLSLDSNRGGVVLRTARNVTGPWTAPQMVVSTDQYRLLYAPFIVPVGLDGPHVYFTLSPWKPYQVFLMRTTLRRDLTLAGIRRVTADPADPPEGFPVSSRDPPTVRTAGG